MDMLLIKYKTKNESDLSQIAIALSLYPWTRYRLNTKQKLHQAFFNEQVTDLLLRRLSPNKTSDGRSPQLIGGPMNDNISHVESNVYR